MKKQEFKWQSADGVEIHAVHWSVEWPVAVVCCVHGLGEHIGRYVHVAEYFAKHNVAMLGYDRRGHGRSGGKRGHSPNFEVLLDEISVLLEKADEFHPLVPVFLYGHSMGGNLVLNHVLRRKPIIKGVIATGSWIRLPEPPSALLLAIAKWMNRLFPSFSQANGLDPEYLSKDPMVVKNYVDDPLVHPRITVSTAMYMLGAANYLNEFSGNMPVPTLIMHGADDKITDPIATEDFARRANGEVIFKKWDNLRHEIHNEPEQTEVLDMMLEWIRKNL